jgi:hypothetical protein
LRRAKRPPPANPKDLMESFLTKPKKDVTEFAFGDSGKTVYLAVQVNNYLSQKFKIPVL